MKTVFIKLVDTGFSQEDIDAAKKLGEGVATTADASGIAGDAIGSVALFSDFDPTGSLFKMVQMVKLFRRVRFLHIKFGVMLEAFLRALDPGFPQKAKTIEQNYLFTGQTPGKLDPEIVPVLWFYPGNLWKPITYMVLWLMKLALFPYLSDLKHYRAKNIRYPIPPKFERKCKIIFFVRKLEFMFFNMVIADGLFVASRTAGSLKLHLFTQYLDGLDSTWDKLWLIMAYFFSMLTIVALFYDFMELFGVSLRAWNLEHIRQLKVGFEYMDDISSQ
jgi:hypothetical protein